MSLTKRKKAMMRVLAQGDVRKNPGLAKKFNKKASQVERIRSRKKRLPKRRIVKLSPWNLRRVD